MEITTQEIADELKISRSAVSFVLNGRWQEQRISRETHDRVMEHLRTAQFRPNRLAISLKTKRTHSIAVIVPLILGSFYQEILNGAETVLGQDYNLQLGVSGYDPHKEARLLESFLERRVDGLLFVGTGHRMNNKLLEEWLAKRIPVVMVDRRCAGVRTHFVASDNVAIGAMGTTHLIQSGMREIHYLVGRIVSSCTDRIRGYHRALRQHRLKPRPILFAYQAQCPSDVRLQAEWSGSNGLRAILRGAKPPFGIFANDLSVAAGVFRAAKEAGLAIPRDLAICTVDAPQFADLLEIPPTHVRQPTEAIGAKAAEILLAQIDRPTPQTPIQTVLLDGELVAGRST